MSRPNHRGKSFLPRLEGVEARTLLSGGAYPGMGNVKAMVNHLHHESIATDPAGVAAILNALKGGAGSEFVKLIRREVPNLNAVIHSFITGKRTQYSIPGLAVRTPGFQEFYNGPKYDHLPATEAGAIVLKKHRLELGAIMRGPFDEPVPAYVVFGLDRGAGASVGPRFASRPGITPDLVVTIRIGPYGTSASGTITDLTTGATFNIDPSRIAVAGPTVRVFLDTGQVPSKGLKIAKYHFAMWTQNTPGGIETVGSFLPDTKMIPVGIQAGGH